MGGGKSYFSIKSKDTREIRCAMGRVFGRFDRTLGQEYPVVGVVPEGCPDFGQSPVSGSESFLKKKKPLNRDGCPG
jgi:hypothetical protein